MATKKVSMTIPEDVLAESSRLAELHGMSLSAYTARILRQAAVAEAMVSAFTSEAQEITDTDLVAVAEEAWA